MGLCSAGVCLSLHDQGKHLLSGRAWTRSRECMQVFLGGVRTLIWTPPPPRIDDRDFPPVNQSLQTFLDQSQGKGLLGYKRWATCLRPLPKPTIPGEATRG
jgi:hypothetical protein